MTAAYREASEERNKAVSILRVVVVALAVLVIVSWLIIAAAHIDDTYNIDHVSGAWLALAKAADNGTFYPPLYDGHYFGGTRYMPLQILVYAGASKLSSNDLAASKLAAYIVAAALLALTYFALRRLGCDWALALGFTATVLVSFVGLFAATSVYGDALPALLQLGAILVVARSTSKRALAAAALLVALAFLTKLSAVWAVLAVAVYLVLRDRRKLILFLALAIGFAVAGVVAADAASDGRMLDNLRPLAFAGGGGIGAIILDSPQRLIRLMEQFAAATWLLVPLALLGTGLAFARRELTIFHLSLITCIVSLLVVFADSGTDFNHLIDLIVLIAIIGGALAAQAAQNDREPLLFLSILVLLVVALGGSYQSRLRIDTRQALSSLRSGDTPPEYNRHPLAGRVGPGETVFSDDPFVPLSLGERPVVGDAFMLLRVLERHPQWRADLVRRIKRHEFDKLALIFPLDLTSSWWHDDHLGIEVATALAEAYRPAGRVIGGYDYYWLYVPRERNRASP
jgi:hypothetical protein